jgi:hypothetical protein
MLQYLQIRAQVVNFMLNRDAQDQLIWRWSPDSRYSTKSVYNALFFGQASIQGTKEVWEV